MRASGVEAAQPTGRTLTAVREEARGCRACPLWKVGTQTVFGEGPAHAPLMMVGEQPGDREDRSGHPFVGPAGRLLDQALAAAGKVRIHKKPNGKEVAACRPWLERELQLVRPSGLLLLGSTAAQALLGPRVRVTVDRGRALDSALAPVVMVTVHPSSLLRAPTDADREREYARFVDDLRRFASTVESAADAPRRRA
jgi:uracil-DNA glycosylase